MNLYKCIIPFFTAFAICFSTMATPSSASLVPVPGYQPVDFSTMASVSAINNPDLDIFENASGYLATLYEAMTTGECDGCAESPIGKHNFMPIEVLTQSWAVALMGEDACVCRYCGISYRDFYDSTYDQYVSDLNTDLGTTTLIDGGIRIYFPSVVYDTSSGNTVDTINLGYTTSALVSIGSYGGSGAYMSRRVLFGYDGVVAPFACTFTAGFDFVAGNSNTSFDLNSIYVNKQVVKGEMIYANTETYSFDGVQKHSFIMRVNANNEILNGVCRVYVDAYPLDIASLGNSTSNDISINSRPTSITGDYGIIGDNGSIIKVDGNMIVDESTNTVYNPVTNTTYNFTDYAYDYSDRSYNLTLEDGSTMKVVYGDENVTINEGDTVYNVYYLIQDPTGSGDSGGGSSGGSDDGSGLGDAVSGFLGALGDVISGLISGLLSLATKALEALTGLGDLLRQMGEALIGFFGGFTDFLGAVFPFLPEETFTILNLGLILMIAAAVFKKFF